MQFFSATKTCPSYDIGHAEIGTTKRDEFVFTFRRLTESICSKHSLSASSI